MTGSVSPADGGTTDPDLALVVDDIRAVVQADPAGIHPHRSDHLAVLLAGYDRRGADLERLRAIEQRAAIVAGEIAPHLSGEPSPQQAAVTARYILTGEAP